MTSKRAKGSWLVLAVGLGLWSPAPAVAADVTDVVDAADDGDPFDLHIEPRFRQELHSAVIRREYPCDPNASDATISRFPRFETGCSEPSVVFRKEMDYERTVNALDLGVQIGLYKDVELHLTLPFIFSDQRVLKFADSDAGLSGDPVDPTNSSIDPADEFVVQDVRTITSDGVNVSRATDLARQSFTTFRYFSLAGGNQGRERKGFGDMTIGLAWNPFNDERDDTKATLKLGFDYLIPTGQIAKSDNDGVGRGIHELKWTIAGSKRFKYLSPYFSVGYVLPIASDASIFQDEGPGQTLIQPGQRAEILFGSEFIPYEDVELGRKFIIDLGLSFDYTAEGRDYNPLFDALGSSECNGLTPNQIREAIEAVADPNQNADRATISRASCRWILDQPGNAEGGAVFDPNLASVGDTQFSHDGILDHEAYTTFGARLRLAFQPSPYVQFGTLLQLEHEQEHFITTARTGVDSDGDDDDTVRFDDPNERNPHHNPNLDAVGNRLRIEETLIFTWSLVLALQF